MAAGGGLLRCHVLFVIACHWAMAITLVFVNKQLMDQGQQGPDITVFITWSQTLVALAAIFIGIALKRLLDQRSIQCGIAPQAFLDKNVLAMSFTYIGVIVMNNLLLKHIGVAFYQVARSSTIIFTVIFSRTFLGVPVSKQVICSCLLIMCGFFMSADQERLLSSLTFLGVLYGILASLFAALCGIYIKRVDKFVDGSSFKVSLMNNLNSFVLLVPLVLSTGQLQWVWTNGELQDFMLWWRLLLTGVLSLLVGLTSVRVISVTSPVTHHISVNAKSLLQTLLAVLVNSETKTAIWWVGNFLVMAGILIYSLSSTRRSSSREIEVAVQEYQISASTEGTISFKQHNSDSDSEIV
ncbi:hypothetical protein BaRGS_00035920 [Batillaria attramentaria]|uniref:Sugar phosphate transporter domain-containing protein n=1 Tax=Batillaria attramentaria TaxID=370345 RepID=A0ABD0JE07_9CAEN